jgi:DNA-binding NarL/FixJ family response regulator
LGQCLLEAVRSFLPLTDANRLRLDVETEAGVRVQAHAGQLRVLFGHLLLRGFESMGGRGRIQVRMRADEAPCIEIADWGPGIPASQKSSAFEPKLSPSGNGSGLGLAIAHRIAQQHGATLDFLEPALFSNELPPPATVFRLRFPFASSSDTEAQKRPRLLVVDDEAIIRLLFLDLMGRDADVVGVASAEEALQALAAGHFDLLVVDQNLPGLSGVELAKRARAMHSDCKLVLMTGYPDTVAAQEVIDLGVREYLVKPFDDVREVRAMLRRALHEQGVPRGRRVDIYEIDPQAAARLSDSVRRLGFEPHVIQAAEVERSCAPVGVLMNWNFAPAPGKQAIELAKTAARGGRWVLLTDHPSLEDTLLALREGASGCIPRGPLEASAVDRELSRAFGLSLRA